MLKNPFVLYCTAYCKAQRHRAWAAQTIFIRGGQHSLIQQLSGSEEGTSETKCSPLQAAFVTWATTPAALPPPASSSCCRAAADEARSAVTSS